jgi:hypothetical protein
VFFAFCIDIERRSNLVAIQSQAFPNCFRPSISVKIQLHAFSKRSGLLSISLPVSVGILSLKCLSGCASLWTRRFELIVSGWKHLPFPFVSRSYRFEFRPPSNSSILFASISARHHVRWHLNKTTGYMKSEVRTSGFAAHHRLTSVIVDMEMVLEFFRTLCCVDCILRLAAAFTNFQMPVQT